MAPSVTRGWIDGAWPVCQRHDDRGGVLPSRVACVSSGFHLATVIRREMPSPGMVRLIFGGEGLRQFRSTGIGDEYLRLFFPDPATGELALPLIDERGRWTYPEGPSKVRCSTYTVRWIDRQREEIAIDFVVHDGGMASDWAVRAKPGDSITINNPRALYMPPDDTSWQLMVADAAGLPALARIVEEMPWSVPTRVFIEVTEPSHEQALVFGSHVTVTWLHGGNGHASSKLEEAVRRVPLPDGPGYVWAAAEQKVVRAIRKYVRQELKMPVLRYELVGYWVDKQNEWTSRWEALNPEVRKRIEAAWASDRDPEDVRDEVDATFDKLGL